MKLLKGDRIYNHGDMANPAHFGTVVRVQTDKWGTHYWIQPDAQPNSDNEQYWIEDVGVSEKYENNGMTRIVHIDAYNAWQRKQFSDAGIYDANYQDAK